MGMKLYRRRVCCKNAFLAGAKSLEAKKEWINELNVFPVPDGDTGTNMTMTIMSAAREVAAVEDPTMEALAKAISSGSLRGARGNSGVIFIPAVPRIYKGDQDGERSITVERSCQRLYTVRRRQPIRQS